MSIAFRSFASLTYGSHPTATLNNPAGLADGDILVALFYCATASAVVPPSGWTEYAASPYDLSPVYSGTVNQRAYWKRAASEPASWDWTNTSTNIMGLVGAWSGCIASGDPNDVTPTNNIGNTINAIATGITIGTANALGIIFTENNASGTETPPSGFSEHGEPTITFGLMDKTYSSTGATGDQTTVLSGSTQWDAFFLALKPAAGGAVTHVGSMLNMFQ